MKLQLLLLPAYLCTFSISACSQCTTSNAEETEIGCKVTDSLTAVPAPVQTVELPHADSLLTAYSRLYSGVSDDGLNLTDTQRRAWQAYSAQVKIKMSASLKKMTILDSLGRNDFSDISQKAKTVFYPFGGPDLFYPMSIYPEAETYCLTGLEPTGTIIRNMLGNGLDYNSFLTANRNFFTYGYFITKHMMSDLHGAAINGTAPLFSMQLGVMGYSIASAGYKVLGEDGSLRDTTIKTNVVEFKVFKEGDAKMKTILYFKTDLTNNGVPGKFLAYISKQDPDSTAVFLKAASYLLHGNIFSTMRNHVLTHSCAIIQDDTGVPYRNLNTGEWTIDFYGKYTHPVKDFGEYCYQKDLEKAFLKEGSHPLQVRIGYNTIPNLMVCRKKIQ